jgi:hypothetical protein
MRFLEIILCNISDFGGPFLVARDLSGSVRHRVCGCKFVPACTLLHLQNKSLQCIKWNHSPSIGGIWLLDQCKIRPHILQLKDRHYPQARQSAYPKMVTQLALHRIDWSFAWINLFFGALEPGPWSSNWWCHREDLLFWSGIKLSKSYINRVEYKQPYRLAKRRIQLEPLNSTLAIKCIGEIFHLYNLQKHLQNNI